jgi:16S rRNA (adenine1518-N6/adenine1519-N6)-dimethyltransferase
VNKNGPRQGSKQRPKNQAGSQPNNSHGHQARKRFGQHFLVDVGVIDDIVRAINPVPGQHLVEIGPGLGALTLPLLDRCQALTVIELDRDLAARLRNNTALNVIEADVLNVDFAALREQPAPSTGGINSSQKLRVVGNLPYNISTPILFHLLAFAPHVQDQHFMLQKEVVDRMCASPGNKDYGRLTVMLQWRYHVESVLDVPPEAFDPPPRVQSAVVRMLPLPLPLPLRSPQDASAAAVDPARLGSIVALAFSQRRKLLRHTLGRWMEAQGVQAPFDLQRRAEEVPVAEYLALAQAAAGAQAPQLPHQSAQDSAQESAEPDLSD